MNKTYRNHLDALVSELLGCWPGNITSHTSNLELFGESGIIENGADDGTALVASCAKDSDYFGHDGYGELVIVVWPSSLCGGTVVE